MIRHTLALASFALVLSPAASFAATTAGYDPYDLRCTYSAGHDGNIQVRTGAMDPDTHDFPVTLTVVGSQSPETAEFEEVYIMSPDEIPRDDVATIRKVAQRLGVDMSRVFTVTEFVLFWREQGGRPSMIFYKFNTQEGSLGVGISVIGDTYETITPCR